MPIQHFSASASHEVVGEALARDGVAVVDELVLPEVMDRVKEELEPWLEATPFGPDDFAGRRTKRTGGLVARSVTSRELLQHPLVLGSVRKLLSRATSIQIHLTQVIAIGPGEPAQIVHRDQWAFDFFPFPKGYDVTCNTIWAMTDFTVENGATRIVPSSNQLEDGLQFKENQTEPAEMKKGSVLIYSGSLYHGAGANRSEHTRYGINLTYSVSWLRQEENQYLSVPLEVARTLPVELLRLLGYARGAYALGYVDDLRDPLEIIRPDLKTQGFGDLSSAAAQAKAQLDGPA